MRWLKQILSRRRRYHELEESIREHLEEKIEDLMEDGLSREEATHKARREFGNVTLIEERSREVWQWPRLETLLQDLRFGARMLVKKPGFTLVAVITLALGIGANTAIFSVANAVMLNPFPYLDHSRIYYVVQSFPGINEQVRYGMWPREFIDFQECKAFDQIAVVNANLSRNLVGGQEPERITATRVSSDFFNLLGVNPLLGRTITAEDQGPRGERVLVITHSLWQRRFGGNPDILGQKVFLDDEPFTVIGVMPPMFYYFDREVFLPYLYDLSRYYERFSFMMVRLKPGVSLDQANAELEFIARNQEQTLGTTHKEYIGRGLYLKSINEFFFEDTNKILVVLLGAVGLVLLIACANIANLLLARGTARTREIALRASLGAGRFRIIRQLLTEGLALALLGGAFGVLLAFLGVGYIISLIPIGMIPTGLQSQIQIDGQVLFGTVIISLLSALLFGIWPALRLSNPDLIQTLKEGSQTSAGLGQARARSLLVIFQVAISLVLLVTAGLTVRSLVRILKIDPGFNTENILSIRLNIPPARAAGGNQNQAIFQQFIDRIRTVPGVQSVASTTHSPFDFSMTDTITVESNAAQGNTQTENIESRTISSDYFQVIGIRLVEGEWLTAEDKHATPYVALVNQTMARRFWPNESALGKRLKSGNPTSNSPWVTIKGVVADIAQTTLNAPIIPEVYFPHEQIPYCCRRMNLVMRTNVDPTGLIGSIKREIQSVDKHQAVYDIKTIDESISRSVSTQRFALTLLLVFAGLALSLSSVGVYGVISYSVAQCTREFGIRIALGAQVRDVLKLVVVHGMVLVSIGVLLGVAAAFALTRLAENLFLGISATDPLTFVICALLLTLVALLACWVPARRATKVDPIFALRSE